MIIFDPEQTFFGASKIWSTFGVKIFVCILVDPKKSFRATFVQRVPINIVHGDINDFLKGWSDYRIKFCSSFKPMVLFIIGEIIKKIHRRKQEISLIWYGYVFFGLHNVISTHKVSYLLCWNVFTYHAMLEILHDPYGTFR